MGNAGDARVSTLLRELVRQTAGRATTAAAVGEDAVLVEEEVDGRRYVLLRAAPRATAAAKIPLSPREQEIVRMVAQGYPNKIIADVLEISSWTVSTYLRRIFAKLGVASRAAMVARILGDRAPNDRSPSFERLPNASAAGVRGAAAASALDRPQAGTRRQRA